VIDPRVPFVVHDRDLHDPVAAKDLTDRLRADGHEVLTDPAGGYLDFLTAEDTEHLLTSPDFRAAIAMALLGLSGVEAGPLHDLWSQLMFGKDDEDHQRIRRAVSARFTPKAVERLRPEVERCSDQLLSAVDPRATVDLWDAYAVPLPALGACALIGLPADDAGALAPLALRVVRAFGIMTDPKTVADTEQSAVDLMSSIESIISDGRVVPGSVLDDLLRDDSAGLSPFEIRALAANLLFGGLDATAKALTTAVLTMHAHPHAWQALVADPPGSAPVAVAECLRYTPPSPNIARLSTTDTEVRGTPLRAYQAALLNLDAVCRDPKLYDEPDDFDVHRPVGRQYAFGAGAHYCLGANLAKLVLTVALRDLAARFPRLTVAADPSDLPWTVDPFRGPVSLPVVLDPAR